MRRFVGFAEGPELALRHVDDRREEQPTVLQLFQPQQLSGELSPDADLPALADALELRLHDCTIA